MVDLASPTDEEMAENKNDILLFKDTDKTTKNKDKTKKTDADAGMPDDEEYAKKEDESAKEGKYSVVNVPRVLKTQNKNYNGPTRTFKLNSYLYLLN